MQSHLYLSHGVLASDLALVGMVLKNSPPVSEGHERTLLSLEVPIQYILFFLEGRGPRESGKD